MVPVPPSHRRSLRYLRADFANLAAVSYSCLSASNADLVFPAIARKLAASGCLIEPGDDTDSRAFAITRQTHARSVDAGGSEVSAFST